MGLHPWLAGIRWLSYFLVAGLVAVAAVVLGVMEGAALREGRGVKVPGSLAGRHAVITGASSGIGFTTAIRLCQRGARVVVHGPDENRTRKAAALVAAECGDTGGSAVPVSAKLDNFAEVRQLAGRVAELLPQVDVLILNAGFNYGAAPVFGDWARKKMEAHPPEYFVGQSGRDHVMSVNHFGHFLLTVLLMPHLSLEASIVVVTGHGMWQGELGRLVPPRRVEWEKQRRHAYLAYEDSKLANMCFGRELRRRVRPGQRVIVHDPGQIRTSIGLDRDSPQYKSRAYLTDPKDTRWTWWHMSADQAAERMIRAAFVTTQPVPDVVYSYWMPAEIFRHLAHHSLKIKGDARRGQWPVKFLRNQFWSFGPLYGGIGPGCSDQAFMDYHWNYSLDVVGLEQFMNRSRFTEFYSKHLARALDPSSRYSVTPPGGSGA